jgi:mono/diheme cytochrome c family protein
MKSGTLTALLFALTLLFSCGDGSSTDDSAASSDNAGQDQASGNEVHGKEVQASEVTLSTPLNQQWVASGKAIYDVKCQGCHKLSDERVVGPGWKGVTKKREPHWIMNMITNVDMMLEKDPEAQKLLEQCLVRMPNQNLSFDDARQVLEFMRNNDGEK